MRLAAQKTNVCEREVSLIMSNTATSVILFQLNDKFQTILGSGEMDSILFHLFYSRLDRIQQQEMILLSNTGGSKIFSSTVELYQLPSKC